ncbi:hypothetical protein PG995_012534 [Apiospora arundinis]
MVSLRSRTGYLGVGGGQELPQLGKVWGTQTGSRIPARGSPERGLLVVLVGAAVDDAVGDIGEATLGDVARVQDGVEVAQDGHAFLEADVVEQGDHGGDDGSRGRGALGRGGDAAVEDEVVGAEQGQIRVGAARLVPGEPGVLGDADLGVVGEVLLDDRVLPLGARVVVGEAGGAEADDAAPAGGGANGRDPGARGREGGDEARLAVGTLAVAEAGTLGTSVATGDQNGNTAQGQVGEAVADLVGIAAGNGLLVVGVGDGDDLRDVLLSQEEVEVLEVGLLLVLIVGNRHIAGLVEGRRATADHVVGDVEGASECAGVLQVQLRLEHGLRLGLVVLAAVDVDDVVRGLGAGVAETVLGEEVLPVLVVGILLEETGDGELAG